MTRHSIPHEVFEEAFAMIRIGHWGDTRASIVRQVHEAERLSPDGWARLSTRTIERRAGSGSRRYVYSLVGAHGSLWKIDHILLRTPGRGGRATCLRVNPNVGAWRRVPWTITDPDLRAARLADAAERNQVTEQVERMARLSAPILARWSAPSSEKLARSMSAPITIAGTAISEEEWRALARQVALEMARSSAPLPTVNGALQSAPLVGAPDNVVSITKKLKPLSSDDQAHNEERERVELVVKRLMKAITARTGDPVYGKLIVALRGLAAEHPARDLLAAVDTAPPGLKPPGIVTSWLPQAMEAALAPQSMTSRADIEARLIGLRRKASFYEDDGGDVPPQLQADIAACENALAELVEEGRQWQ
jgi:hypothetical protein